MMVMKISLERLLVESSKLQDHRQQSCVIRNVTVESVRSSFRSMREDKRIDRSALTVTSNVLSVLVL